MRKEGATVRCAIYTRKSTEEGLDQEFNSLDAQREAAEAFIRSQKGAGWKLVPARYDDGGFSGGNLDRPGLQRLLGDIDGRRVDCVVVYKVDRLSRSLLDFARLIDRFDQRSVSFVSVTQQFNTTSSLGRLTLNILLSFAEFERQIISERTRDKMSAARRKGKWVGGAPVLGYDIDPAGRRLIVNEKEAQRVREIFRLFQTHRSLLKVVAELTARRWRNKSWSSKSGIQHVGRAFTNSTVRCLLTNVIYAGQVKYRGEIYPGEHPAIIDPALWEEVSAEFESRQRRRADVVRSNQKALLAGLLFCRSCQRPMVATYTAKRGRWFRYYVCQKARQNGWRACPTKSVAAALIEESVIAQLRAALSSEETRQQLQISETDWQVFQQGDPGALVGLVVEHMAYDGITGGVTLTLGIGETMQIEYTVPLRRLVRPRPFTSSPAAADEPQGRAHRMTRILALAHRLDEAVRSGAVRDYGELARLGHVSPARISQFLTLLHLAPAIQEYLLFVTTADRLPITEPELRKIAREPRWDLQRERFERQLEK